MTDPSPADRLEAGVQGLRVPEPRTDRESLLLKVGVAIVADRRPLHRPRVVGCVGHGQPGRADPVPDLRWASSASPSWWPAPAWSCATRWPGCSGSGWPGSSPSTASRRTGRWTRSAASRAPWAGRAPPAGSFPRMALRGRARHRRRQRHGPAGGPPPRRRRRSRSRRSTSTPTGWPRPATCRRRSRRSSAT